MSDFLKEDSHQQTLMNFFGKQTDKTPKLQKSKSKNEDFELNFNADIDMMDEHQQNDVDMILSQRDLKYHLDEDVDMLVNTIQDVGQDEEGGEGGLGQGFDSFEESPRKNNQQSPIKDTKIVQRQQVKSNENSPTKLQKKPIYISSTENSPMKMVPKPPQYSISGGDTSPTKDHWKNKQSSLKRPSPPAKQSAPKKRKVSQSKGQQTLDKFFTK